MFSAIVKIQYYNTIEEQIMTDYITLSTVKSYADAVKIVEEYYSQDLIAVEVELLDDPFIYIKEETYNQMKTKDKE
jgi:hypothetical protein